MTTQEPELLDTTIFHKLWAIGALAATIFVIPVTLWGDKYPWLIAIPVLLCVVWAVYLDQVRRPRSEGTETHGPITALPQEFKGLVEHRRSLGLYIEVQETPSELQMNLFGADEPVGKTQKKVILLRDERGRKFTLVECDRFMAKVNSLISDDIKRAAEHAFKMGWKRIEQLAEQNPELARLFEDPLVLDAVKTDFQSNVSICIAKSSDVAADEFIAESSNATAVAQYRIAPEKGKHAAKAH